MEFKDDERQSDADALTLKLLERLYTEGLIEDNASDDDILTLRREWQLPMYNVELKMIEISEEEIEKEREQIFYSAAGYD